MIFGSVFVTSAAGNTVEKKVSLFDLSGFAEGETTELPDGATRFATNVSYASDNYNGTKSVVTDENGNKVFRQNFDKLAKASGNPASDKKSDNGNTVAFTIDIPSVYLPYISKINLDMENKSGSNLVYEFGITDGDKYSKSGQCNRVLGTDKSVALSLAPQNLYKIGAGNIAWYIGLNNNSAKWDDISTVKKLFFVISTPMAGCEGTEGYYLDIKDISLTLSGDKDAIDEAVSSVAESWKTVFDFEEYADGTNKPGGIDTSGTAKVVENRAYAVSGTKSLNFVSSITENYQDKTLVIPLGANVKKATGFSFWIYNSGENAQSFKLWLSGSNGNIAQTKISAPAKEYVKIKIDFDNLKTYNDNYFGDGGSAKSLTAEEIASVTKINLRPSNAKNHPGYYIDDVKYEQETKHEYTKTLPLNGATFRTGTTANVTEDGKIVFTPTETSVTAYASIPISEKFFAGASAVTFNFTNTMSGGFYAGTLVRGTSDSGNSKYYWKWGNTKDNIGISKNGTTSSTLNFDGSGAKYIFGTYDEWYIGQSNSFKNNPPSGSEKTTFTSLELRLFDFKGTDGNITLNSITVTYEGNTVKQDSNISNGSVTIENSKVFAGDKAGFMLTHNDGYILKNGSVKLNYSNGTEVALDKRDGFRQTNNGYYYTFDMPDADVTVSAEFVPTETMTVTAAADETDKSLKFELSVALESANTTLIDGVEREIISVGALVTTDDLLTLYYPDSSFESLTRELAASDNYIANAIDDINIGANGTGLIYDRAKEFIRFNVILNNLSAESRKANFYVRGYIEYKNDNGDKEIAYIDTETYCYNDLGYGENSNIVSLSKGISYSGVFEKSGIANISKTDKIFDKATFEDIAAQGFDHVRIPVDFSSNTDDTTTDYKFVSGTLEKVDIAVKKAMQAGLTVVLDFHQACKLNDDTLYTNPTAVSPKYIKIWEQLAEHYKDYPEALVFEVINEPAVDDTTFTNAILMKLQEQVLDISKSANANRNIIVTVRNANSSYQLSDLSDKLKNDSNVIVSAHCYDPMYFTHQGATWIKDNEGNIKYPAGVTFTETVADDIKKAINNCAAFEKATGRTVILGEFGVYLNGASMSDATQYIKAVTDYCAEKNIDWCYWEYNSGFGAYNESAKTWKSDILTALGLQ